MEAKEYTWKEKELEEFRMAVLKEKDLKCKTDDIFLLSFLRARKYDRERALKLLKNYYAIRKKYTDVFKDLRPSALETFLQMGMMCSKRLETGHWDATKVKPIDLVRCVLLLVDMELNDHPIQVNGVYILIDAKTISWRHAIQFSPRILYLIIACFYQCAPLIYKGVHIVNVNKYLRAIVAMAYPFLPYKLKQRLYFHGSNMENLHKEIDRKYLPAEFGGELPPFDESETKQKLRDLEEFFVENEKYWTEEKITED
ncbi:alpha-tocopherol transfer protein-like isoform X4 [Centruroides sculpturatus]|uniref:alpha-tocopherol transfer protein-like isoform X4 n=1 Tax=Centruroides sculpturatus TaxID=218467 RepID=UPI000C6E7477|nr:alpha-tocopherol transfer protein-like isoform X4 [Centruroides sculpturatus]